MAMVWHLMSPVSVPLNPDEVQVTIPGLHLTVGDCVLTVTAGPFKNKELVWLCMGNFIGNGDAHIFQDKKIAHNYIPPEGF